VLKSYTDCISEKALIEIEQKVAAA